MNLDLDFVLESTGGVLLAGSVKTGINGISTDSRHVGMSDLFVALPGERFDGHDFVADVIKNKAAAVLIARKDCLPEGEFDTAVILVKDTLEALQQLAASYRQLFKIPVVAITGSVGKTTTKDLLAECLSASFNTLKTRGNYNNEIGMPLTLLELNQEHRAAVVEIGMRAPGQIFQLSSILAPSYAIITNVEAVHLETMGSLANIARAKCEVLEFIQSDCFALINGDNDLLLETAADYSCRFYTFGYRADNNIRIISVENDGSGINVELRIFACYIDFYLPVPVTQLAGNLASAAGMAFLMGADLQEIKKNLADFKPSGSRMNIIPLDGGGLIIDDSYNANPLSMMAALESLREMSKGRKTVAVIGDMLELGSYEQEGHIKVGKKAAELGLDILVTIGPRAQYYREGAVVQGMPAQNVFHFQQREEALEWLKNNISFKDIVLFKASRGMQLDILANEWIKA